MLQSYKVISLPCISLINQTNIVIILIVVVVVFSFLLIHGVRKSYLLKKENDRLNSMNTTIEDESEKPYKDFTDGHMYGGN